MSKKSKNKGNRAERAVAKLFREWWGGDFARTPQSGGFRTQKFRQDWNAEGDLVTPDDEFPFSVECKWQESWHMEQLLKSEVCDPWHWWKQTREQTGEDKISLLIFTRNHQPWYYMIREDDALDSRIGIPGFSFSCDVPDWIDDECGIVRIGLWDDFAKTKKEDWIDEKK
jgi:hypothetical protein